MSFLSTGSTREVDAFLGQLSSEQQNGIGGLRLRKHWALHRGDAAEYVRLDQIRPASHPDDVLAMAVISATQGDNERVRMQLGDSASVTRAVRDKDPRNFHAWWRLAQIEALLGNKDDALRCARRACDLVPASSDAIMGARALANLAFVKAWTGDKAGAIADYSELLRRPYGGREASNRWSKMTTVHVMRHDPHYSPLHGDPRFEALLNDPKNNAPLF